MFRYASSHLTYISLFCLKTVSGSWRLKPARGDKLVNARHNDITLTIPLKYSNPSCFYFCHIHTHKLPNSRIIKKKINNLFHLYFSVQELEDKSHGNGTYEKI